MMKEHLHRHGLTFGGHFRNNWLLTIMALKSAFYTLGHSFNPRISGMRASELHNEMWVEGRKASMNDLRHRLENGLYTSKEEAVAEYRSYAALYNEEPLMTNFVKKIEEHYS